VQPFTLLSSAPINGTWNLIVRDNVPGNDGKLLSWGLSMNGYYYEWKPQVTGMSWYNGSSIYTGAASTSTGSGRSNTSAIISTQGTGDYAAAACDNAVLNGYDDWYLPSLNELKLIYNNSTKLGTSATRYWSSSESTASSAYYMNFSDGASYTGSKSNLYAVRPVRNY
jgi:hypothetical protein